MGDSSGSGVAGKQSIPGGHLSQGGSSFSSSQTPLAPVSVTSRAYRYFRITARYGSKSTWTTIAWPGANAFVSVLPDIFGDSPIFFQSARVNLNHKTYGYHDANDMRGGYTPNPLETKGGVGVTSVQNSGNLSLTYHLEIQTRLNLSRGQGTRLFAKLKEPDHWNDFNEANARFQGAAGTLVGQRFNSESAAGQGLRNAVDPVVQQVYDESRQRYDYPYSNAHRPIDLVTGRYLGPNE